MNINVAEIKQDILSLNSLKEDIANIDTVTQEIKESSAKNTENITKSANELKSAKNEIDMLKSTCTSLQEQQLNLDTYSRRDNLLIENVAEGKGEGRDCSSKILTFLKKTLKMDEDQVSKIKIVFCHHIGHVNPNQNKQKPRTTICRFHYFTDREDVWNKHPMLAGRKIRLSEDFSKEIVSRHNMLAPIMFEAHRQWKRASMVVDRLKIENKTYTVDILGALPESLNPLKLSTKPIGDHMLTFDGSLSPLSNFHPFSFVTSNGTMFKNSEQYFHHNKALLLNDEITAAKIMAAQTLADCKFLGHQVKIFKFDEWKSNTKERYHES